MKIAKLDHHWEYRCSDWPRYVGTWFVHPPIHPRLLRWGRFKHCLRPGLLHVPVARLHDGDLHAVGWGEGPRALVTPVKAIRVGVGLIKNRRAIWGMSSKDFSWDRPWLWLMSVGEDFLTKTWRRDPSRARDQIREKKTMSPNQSWHRLVTPTWIILWLGRITHRLHLCGIPRWISS